MVDGILVEVSNGNPQGKRRREKEHWFSCAEHPVLVAMLSLNLFSNPSAGSHLIADIGCNDLNPGIDGGLQRIS